MNSHYGHLHKMGGTLQHSIKDRGSIHKAPSLHEAPLTTQKLLEEGMSLVPPLRDKEEERIQEKELGMTEQMQPQPIVSVYVYTKMSKSIKVSDDHKYVPLPS